MSGKRRSLWVVAALAVFGFGCGGGEPNGVLNFHAPDDLLISATPYRLNGENRRLALAANPQSGTITVLDVDGETVLDLAPFDARKTGIAIGGEPVSLAQQAVGDGTVTDRIFAADQANNRVVIAELLQNNPGDDGRVRYRYGDGGGAAAVGATRPVFEDNGRFSSPRAGAVAVDPAKVTIEDWFLEFTGDNYVVKGSASGEQAGRLVENRPYTSDSGSFSLTLDRGIDPTNGGDNWIFSTYSFKPLPLPFSPCAVAVHAGSELVAVSRTSGEVAVYQIGSYALLRTATLSDGSGDVPLPRAAYLFGDKLLVLNQLHPSAIIYDLVSGTQVAIPLPGTAHSAFASQDQSLFYLLLEDPSRLLVYSLAGGALLPQFIDFPSAPLTGASGNFGWGANQGAVVTQENGVYLVDLATFTRIDLYGGGGTRSRAGSPKFQDFGNSSHPHMTSVTTRDGTTKSEVWTVVYEGVIPGAAGRSGQLSGTSFSDAGQRFQTRRVQAGDRLVVEQPQALELEIAAVANETVLTLTADPGLTASGVVYTVRPGKSFVVSGSLSGTQNTRAKTETTYQSDNGEIGFSIFDDISSPLSRGDLFTFRTFDGVQAVSIRGGDPSRALGVTIRDGSRDFLWLTYAGNSALGIIDFLDKSERKFIR